MNIVYKEEEKKKKKHKAQSWHQNKTQPECMTGENVPNQRDTVTKTFHQTGTETQTLQQLFQTSH